MGQKKLQRFEEIRHLPNVLQYPEDIKGKWNQFFKNEQPLVLELACGKGEYTIGLAAMHPERNFLGVDLKGNRIWAGAKKAIQLGLANTAFLRIQIDGIANYFAPGEVSEIWITFPDPQLRLSKIKKRLTHPKFLRLYQQFLRPGGKIHLKTDSPGLFQFTTLVASLYGCTMHESYDDLYAQPLIAEELKIKTHYEGLDIAGSSRIHYLCFSLPATLPGTEKDEALKNELKHAAALD